MGTFRVTTSDFKGALKPTCTLWRRYSEFQQLRDYLEATYPYIVIPPLPEKRAMFSWNKQTTPTTDNSDTDFVERRRTALEVRCHTKITLQGFKFKNCVLLYDAN